MAKREFSSINLNTGEYGEIILSSDDGGIGVLMTFSEELEKGLSFGEQEILFHKGNRSLAEILFNGMVSTSIHIGSHRFIIGNQDSLTTHLEVWVPETSDDVIRLELSSENIVGLARFISENT